MDGITVYNHFLGMHLPQLLLSNVPEHFWHTLSKKLEQNIFDSGTTFQLLEIDYEGSEIKSYEPLWSVVTTRDIERSDPNHIYLVDHAWTFQANSVKTNLRNTPNLLERMCAMMKVTGDTTEEKIEKVSHNVWRYAHTYALGGNDFSAEDRVPVWYVLDELGSGIIHSDNPNFRTVPFMHIPRQITYTLLFPIQDIEEGEPITRNFVEGNYTDSLQREAMLIPWKHYNNFDDDFSQEEPDSNYFLEGHIVEDLPDLEILSRRETTAGEKLKVFSNYRFINEHLTLPEFEIVHNEDDADIVWYTDHFKTFRDFSINTPNKFVNQFPFEYVITIKDLLAIVARRCSKKYDNLSALETSPAWLPTTFNMKTELSKFVAYYMQRKKAGLDNHWICKPYNLARSLDTYVTDDLYFMCRLPQSGPKIAQKYIENSVLFERPDIGRVKFDIRYVILLTSVNPTQVYIYNNFFLRFANKPFAMDNFEDYEQHFTVMNYTENTLFRMLCAQFKEAWALQNANYNWDEVEKSIFGMISEVFKAATCVEPPRGIGKSPQSRALYAADIMLKWQKVDGEMKILPQLLEVNWMPDCRRACEYYPDFYNDVFSVMFLNKDVDTCTKIL
ncbi:tubulin--tyrosine ligase-like protein 12 [Amyelois transitella]|uniref:tubulin--tyrosine ligase-like protein 12 n=1 Tax=Amyelois transitella TaxID=680683 RepID=UPI00298FF21C|nr:tubulin--tyrosine ligase-like protein 12 [Amyelois transitella]